MALALAWSVIVVGSASAQDAQQPFDPVLSSFDIPITIPNRVLETRIEAEIPRNQSIELSDSQSLGIGKFTFTEYWFLTGDVTRQEINVSSDSNGNLVSKTHLNIVLSGHSDHVPTIHGRASGTMGLRSHLTLGDDWRIKSSSTPILDIEEAKIPLGFTAMGKHFGIDLPVATLAEAALKPMVARQMPSVDRKIGDISLKENVEQLWNSIGDSVLIQDVPQTWLTVCPTALRCSDFAFGSYGIEVSVGLDCYINVDIGPKPKHLSSSKLPEMKRNAGGRQFNINLPLTVTCEELTKMFKPLVVGTDIATEKGVNAIVKDVLVSASGSQVAIKIDLQESTILINSPAISLILMGTPVLNRDLNAVTLENVSLDKSANSRNADESAFVSPLAKLISDRLRWNFSKELEEQKTMINKQIGSFNIQNGIQLKASINEVNPTRIAIDGDKLWLHSVCKGSGTITITEFDF
jgi:hypothetical protein